MTHKPYAESCEENRGPILAVLRDIFADRRRVLEIGSGTGQHAVYFAPELPHLTWQTADLPQHHAGIRMWLDEAGLPNVLPPLALDAHDTAWHDGRYDAVFSANTLHIMSWQAVERCFAGIGAVLEPGGVLAIYGPFNYGGRFTSDSNARFDAWLKARDPASGVRDFEAVNALAAAQGLALWQDIAMPANNRTLVWRRGCGFARRAAADHANGFRACRYGAYRRQSARSWRVAPHSQKRRPAQRHTRRGRAAMRAATPAAAQSG